MQEIKNIQPHAWLFPGLTPKALAIPPLDKKFEENKQKFLVGPGSPPLNTTPGVSPGVYGADVKLEYDYKQPEFGSQFKQLITAYQTLGKELKPVVELPNIDKIITWVTLGARDGYSKIAEAERPQAFKLFKQQMEDILFCMRASLTESRKTKDPKELSRVQKKIASSLSRLDEAFTRCSEQITESIMEEQLQWMPVTGIADHLLRRRTAIVEIVAREVVEVIGAMLDGVHAGPMARSIAYRECYGVIPPQHSDPYGSGYLRQPLHTALTTKFPKMYSYDSVCSEVSTVTQFRYLTILRNYEDKDSLTSAEKDLLLAEMQDLLGCGACQSADVIETVRTASSATQTRFRVHPRFKENLPLYCALYAPIILEREGFVKPLKQWIYDPPERIQVDGETLLTRRIVDGEFYTSTAMLSTELKGVKPNALNDTGDTALSLVLQPALNFSPKQQFHLVKQMLKHPDSDIYILTLTLVKQDHTYGTLTAHSKCPITIFHLFWDTLLSLGAQQNKMNLIQEFANHRPITDYTALMYAVESGELARVEKLMQIPGLDYKGVERIQEDKNPEIRKIKQFIAFLQAIEEQKTDTAVHSFHVLVRQNLPHANVAEYKKILTLLKNRYANPSHPHRAHYQQFLKALATQEREVACLVALRADVPTIDLQKLRQLLLRNGKTEQETPLRAAIVDHDEEKNNNEELIEYLLTEAKADPHDKSVAGENAWMLVARKDLFKPEQQESLLSQLIASSRYRIKFYSILRDLIAEDRTATAFVYIVSEMKMEISKGYLRELGRDKVATAALRERTFLTTNTDKKLRETKVNLETVGRQILQVENKELKGKTELTIAKELGTVMMQPVVKDGSSLFHQVAVTFQRDKIEALLLETSELDFKSVFVLPEIHSQDIDKKNEKHIVAGLFRLLEMLHSSPQNYQHAITQFQHLLSFAKGPEEYEQQYARLLTIIYRQCRMLVASHRPCYKEFFKRLAQVETHVVGLNLLKPYVKIDLLKQLGLAAKGEWTDEQFTVVWQEVEAKVLANELEFRPSTTFVTSLVTAKEGENERQLAKLVKVLQRFQIIDYLHNMPFNSAIANLVNLLLALKAGHWEQVAIYHSFLGTQKISSVEIGMIIKIQLSTTVSLNYLTQIKMAAEATHGLFNLQKQIQEEKNADKNVTAFLLCAGLESSGTSNIVENFRLLLMLFAKDKGQEKSFSENVMTFCQSLLDHFTGMPQLQRALILQVVSFDEATAAQLWFHTFLYRNSQLLPEKLLLQQLDAVKDEPDVLSFLYGELCRHEQFSGYRQAQAFFAQQLDITQVRSYAAGDKSETVTALELILGIALCHKNESYYPWIEQIICATKANRSLDDKSLTRLGKVPLIQMVQIPDVAWRHRLVDQWLSSTVSPEEQKHERKHEREDKHVSLDSVDKHKNTALLQAISMNDEGLALKLFAYASRALSTKQYQILINWENLAKESALSLALRFGQKQLAIALLLSGHINHSKLPTVTELDVQQVGFTPYNIIKLFRLCKLPVGYPEINDTNLLKSFLNCIDPSIIHSPQESKQVLAILQSMHSASKIEFIILVSRVIHHYAQSKPDMVLTITQAFPNCGIEMAVAGKGNGIRSVLEYTVLMGDLTLAQRIIHQQGATLDAATKRNAVMMALNNRANSQSIIPLMDVATRSAFLDFFFAQKFHESSPDVWRDITSFIDSNQCDFLTFIKVLILDSQNHLLQREMRYLSDKNRLLYTLLKKLIYEIITDAKLESFTNLILCIDFESEALPALLILMQKKLLDTKAQQLLSQFLQHQQRWPELQKRPTVLQITQEFLVTTLRGQAPSVVASDSKSQVTIDAKEIDAMPPYYRAIMTQNVELLAAAKETKANVEEKYLEDTPLKLVMMNYDVTNARTRSELIPFLDPATQEFFVQALLEAKADATSILSILFHTNFYSFTILLWIYHHQHEKLDRYFFHEHNPHSCKYNDSLFIKKNCFLNMLTLEQISLSERMNSFELLLASVSDTELNTLFKCIPTEKSAIFNEVLDAFLQDSHRFTKFYTQHKQRLWNLLQHRYALNSLALLQLLLNQGSFYWAYELMFKHSPDLKQVTRNQETPLMLAAQAPFGDAKLRQLVVSHIVGEMDDWSTVTQDAQCNALMLAANNFHCDAESFHTLLSVCSPAIMNQRSRSGKTALTMTVEQGQVDKLQVLLARQADFTTETLLAAALVAQQQEKTACVDIFFTEAKDRFKRLLVTEYQSEYKREHKEQRLVQNQISLGVLTARAYVELHGQDALPLAEMPVDHPPLYQAILRRYPSYKTLFDDEKWDAKRVENRLELLQRAEQLNAPCYAGMSVLDYALQQRSHLLLIQLLAIPSLKISSAQVTLVYRAESALRDQALPALFTKFIQDSYREDKNFTQATALFAEFYADLEVADSVALLGLLDKIQPHLAAVDFQRLHSDLWQVLFTQLAARDDVQGCLTLLTKAGGGQRQAAMECAIQYRWENLLGALLKVLKVVCEDFDGRTLLVLQALQHKQASAVKLLLETKVSLPIIWPHSLPPMNDSVLTLAIAMGDLAICQTLVEHAKREYETTQLPGGEAGAHFADFLNHKNALGKSALYLAAEQGRTDIVAWLLSLPGIDAQAFCETRQRTAVLAAYQPPAEPSRQSSSTTTTSAETKIETKSTEAKSASVEVTATSTQDATLLQLFAAKGQVFQEKDYLVANIAYYVRRDCWHLAIPELFTLADRYNPQAVAQCLEKLVFKSFEHHHLFFFKRLLMEALKAGKIALLSYLGRDLQSSAPVLVRVSFIHIGGNLEDDTCSFSLSQPALQAIADDDNLRRHLWPTAALETMRACHRDVRNFTNALNVMGYVFTKALRIFIENRYSETNRESTKALRFFIKNRYSETDRESWTELFTQLIAIQQKFLQDHAKSEDLVTFCRQVSDIRTPVLHLAAAEGITSWVSLLLENAVFSGSPGSAFSLVDVNAAQETTNHRRQPLAFTMLAKIQQGPAETKGVTNPYTTILEQVINTPTWQDNSRDQTGTTLVMKALSAPLAIFTSILQCTHNATLLVADDKEKTLVDYVLELEKEEIKKEKANLQQLDNCWNVRKELQQRFATNMQILQELKSAADGALPQLSESSNAELERTSVVDQEGLCQQARALAVELLKFDIITLQSYTVNVFRAGFWQVSVANADFVRDMQQWQIALAGNPKLITAEILARVEKLPPQFFVKQLASVWTQIAPPVVKKQNTSGHTGSQARMNQLAVGKSF